MVQRLGFGMMRLPMLGDKVDIEQTKKMVDHFIEEGYTYFDTAHGYISKQSELAVKECLTDRYPRGAYTLTDKFSSFLAKGRDDVVPFFENQLKRCGVTYFDYYLHHSLDKESYQTHKDWGVFEAVKQFKKEGRVKHIGMSFHDKADVLDRILTEQPHIEYVQLQFNYLDYDDPEVQSAANFAVCEKHDKPVIVMEPIKGGNLVNLPKEAQDVLRELDTDSPAALALRFVAGFPRVKMILSGMSNTAQMEENTALMKEPKPLTKEEEAALLRVREIVHSKDMIPCTACEYCVEGCPQKIYIPRILSAINKEKVFHDPRAKDAYEEAIAGHGRAQDCIACGQCESVCPQEIKVISHLETAKDLWD